MSDSAKNLARSIRDGTVTATQAAQACLDRIDRHNPAINAIVTLNKEAALNAAKAADIRIGQGGDLPPLFGVPIFCGIDTHHQRRSNPNQYGYNVGCLEGVNPFEIENVPTNDGVNHPADRNVS